MKYIIGPIQYYLEKVKSRVFQWGVIEFTALCNDWSLVPMAERLEQTSMSCWSVPLVHIQTHLQPMWKKYFCQAQNTQLQSYWLIECQLTLSSHTTTYWILGELQSLRILKLWPAKAQEWVMSFTIKCNNLVQVCLCLHILSNVVSTHCSLHKTATSRTA